LKFILLCGRRIDRWEKTNIPIALIEAALARVDDHEMEAAE
jgi:hypothetical protein